MAGIDEELPAMARNTATPTTSRMPMPPERIISRGSGAAALLSTGAEGPGTEDPRQAGTPGRAGSHQSPPTQKILSGMGSAELAVLPRRRR